VKVGTSGAMAIRDFDRTAARFRGASTLGFTGTGNPSPDHLQRRQVLRGMDLDGVRISNNFEGE